MKHPCPAPRGAPAHTLCAPERLDANARVEFRRKAIDLIERSAAAGATTVTLDLSATTDVDASGLGILVLVQKRAKERGMSTQLLSASEPVRRLLVLTRLDYLFQFVD